MSLQPARIAWIILAALLLTACSQPLAAEWIVAANPTPIAVYPPPDAIAYHAYLEILTADVDKAAAFASRAVYDLGGQVENSRSWFVGSQKYTSLDLSVSSYNYEALRSSLARLGVIVNETSVGEPRRGAPLRGTYPVIQVTLQLDPVLPTITYPTRPGWNPLNTLQSAWQVFMRIFGFLVDILIWVLVVAGPFALIGAILWRLLRRKPTIKANPDENA